MRRWLAASALALLWGHAACAAPPAEPAVAPPPNSTVLHLAQTAERKLARDVLHVELRAEKTGADPQTVEAAINQRMAKALATARAAPGVEVATGSYSVYREAPQKAPPQWTGSQTLSLSGSDAGALLDLAGKLQSAGLVMANLGYDVSPETVHDAEDALTAEALAALQRRAAAVAQQLRLAVLGIRDLTVGNAGTGEAPMPRMPLAAAATMPAPVAAPGEATVRVTVSADILLGAAKQ